MIGVGPSSSVSGGSEEDALGARIHRSAESMRDSDPGAAFHLHPRSLSRCLHHPNQLGLTALSTAERKKSLTPSGVQCAPVSMVSPSTLASIIVSSPARSSLSGNDRATKSGAR